MLVLRLRLAAPGGLNFNCVAELHETFSIIKFENLACAGSAHPEPGGAGAGLAAQVLQGPPSQQLRQLSLWLRRGLQASAFIPPPSTVI